MRKSNYTYVGTDEAGGGADRTLGTSSDKGRKRVPRDGPPTLKDCWSVESEQYEEGSAYQDYGLCHSHIATLLPNW